MTAHFIFCIAIGFSAVIGQTCSSLMCYHIKFSNSSEQQCCSGHKDNVPECTCHYGWKMGFCDKPLLCYIASGASKVPPEGNMKDVIFNSENQWRSFLKECQPECLNQFNDHTIPFIGNIKWTEYFLISNELKCNTIVATNHQTISKMYIISGVAMLIIILLVMVVVTLYTIRRKRRTRHMMKNKPMELINNDVGFRPMSDTYEEVLPPILEYDYVIEPPNRICDEGLLVHYDDVNVQPIIIYDDVNVKSNQKFTMR